MYIRNNECGVLTMSPAYEIYFYTIEKLSVDIDAQALFMY